MLLFTRPDQTGQAKVERVEMVAMEKKSERVHVGGKGWHQK
jgi:hypothetical protein